MKELAIYQGMTEAFILSKNKALLQVDGAGRYDVQASLDGTTWSKMSAISANCDQHSRTVLIDLLAGVHLRVLCVSGTLEAARYVESGESGGGGSEEVSYDFGNAETIGVTIINLGDADTAGVPLDFGRA